MNRNEFPPGQLPATKRLNFPRGRENSPYHGSAMTRAEGKVSGEEARSTRHRLELLASFCLIPGLWRKSVAKTWLEWNFHRRMKLNRFENGSICFFFYFAITIKYIQIYNFWFCIITSYHGKEISLFLLLDRIKKFTRIIKFNPNAFRVNKFYNIVDSEMFQKILECLSCKIFKRDQIRNNSKII